MVSSVYENEITGTKFEIEDGMNLSFHNSEISAFVSTQTLKCEPNDAGSSKHTSFNVSNHNNSTSHRNNSPKMGSRRIFTPQFKLQVLESYRNDNDCKGNQRATARKYNIHRRQIQKWLQCEPSLRSSVININQTTIKHQFHNISHHHHEQQQSQLRQSLQIPLAASNKNSFFGHQSLQPLRHQAHHQLPLDTVRQNVALNAIAVSSMPTDIKSATNANATAHEVLSAASLAAVVAAAAVGTITIPSTTAAINSSTTASPLRPTAIGGSSATAITQSLLHPHHQHHYAVPYTHTPVNNVPVSVPVLTRHIPAQHLPHYQHHNHPYPYPKHNIPTHTHLYTHVPPPTSLQPSTVVPSESLSVNVLSAPRASTRGGITTTPIIAIAASTQTAEEQDGNCSRSNDLRELSTHLLLPTAAKTKAMPTLATVEENSNVYTGSYMYQGSEIGYETKLNNSEYSHQFSDRHQIYYTGSATMPMDLSINRTEPTGNEGNEGNTQKCRIGNVMILASHAQSSTELAHGESVVDLTFKKRRASAIDRSIDEKSNKLSKLSNAADDTVNNNADLKTVIEIKIDQPTNGSKENIDYDVDTDIDVDIVEGELANNEKSAPVKPVKLFKPYLLDDDSAKTKYSSDSAYTEIMKGDEPCEPSVWNNQPACLSPHSYDSRQDCSRGSNFQSPVVEKYTFPEGSPTFSEIKSINLPSALSPTSVPALSPTGFLYPKGSPVSGYESSSSTYSEFTCRSDSDTLSSLTNHKTYRVQLKMHTVCNSNIKPTQRQNQVQKWLDQDENAIIIPPAAKNSIIL